MKYSSLGLLLFTGVFFTMPAFAEEKEDTKKTGAKEMKLEGFTSEFNEEKSDLVSSGTNPWFSLEPGWIAEYDGEEDGEKGHLTITVTDKTKLVDGIETRIVEEKESANGKIVEISQNYFAISKRTNNVYYFGEDSRTYKDGKETGSGGSWEAGINGAKYGLIMPGSPMIGAKYWQEMAVGEAEDRAEITSLEAEMKTPAGDFNHCVKTIETSPLEPHSKEAKIYARGMGLVQDGDLLLISAGKK